MKKITSFAGLIMIVLLTPVGSSYAQTSTENTENKIVEREANFTLKFVGEDVGDVNVTLKAVYETKTNKCKLEFVNKDGSKNNPIMFTYPLNYDYLQNEVNESYSKYILKQNNSTDESVKKYIISQTSIEAIFFWMYAMKGELEDKSPIAGKMHVRRYAMVFENENDLIGEKEREKQLDSTEKTMYYVTMQANSLFNEVIQIGNAYKSEAIKELENKTKEDDSKKTTEEETIKLSSKIQVIDDFVKNLKLKPEYGLRIKDHFETKFGGEMDDYSAYKAAQMVQIPVLVIHDQNDEDVSVNSAYHIDKHLAHSELFITEGLGHRKIVGDPSVIETILKFIE